MKRTNWIWYLSGLIIIGLASGPLGAVGALDEDPFVPDPAFWSGQYRQDSHGQPNQNGSAWAQRIVRLANGRVIVAGRVPASDGSISTANNLGLSHYDPEGFFTPGEWANLNYPNSPSALYSGVHGLRRWGNRLFVLADVANPSPGHRTVVLHVFSLDSGQALQTRLVFQGNYDFHGAGMTIVSHVSFGDKLIIVGSRMFNNQGRPVMRRYSIAANGDLDDDGPMQILDVGACGPASDCRVRGIAGAGGSIGAAPRIYIAGTFQWGGPPAKDYFVMRLNIDGVADEGGFGALGVTLVGFDQPDSGNDDELVTLQAHNVGSLQVADDQVFLVGNVDRRCKPGIGVARLNHNGVLDNGFGQGGRLLFGGSGADPGQLLCLIAARDEARDAVLAPAQQRLAIVGRSIRACLSPPCGPTQHGNFAIVDGNNGALREHRELPAYLGSTNDRHSDLLGVAGNGAGRFLATGYIRYPDNHVNPQLAGKLRYATIGVASDRIFGHGFQAD